MQVLVSVSIIAGALIVSAALERLKSEVAETRGVAASAVAALTAIPQLIRDAVERATGDAAALESELNGLADELDASQADLAGAINANPGPADPGGDDTVTGEGDPTVPAGDAGDIVDADHA
jgi:hypothetical protein